MRHIVCTTWWLQGWGALWRRLIRQCRELGAAILDPRESNIAKSKERDVIPALDQPHRALLIELKGETTAEDGSAAMVRLPPDIDMAGM